MAEVDQEQTETAAQPSSGSQGVWGGILWGLIGLAAGVGGFIVPGLLPELPVATKQEKHSGPAFVSFGEIVVNLDEGRLNRYLRVHITLQTTQSEKERLTELLEEKKAILKNWLLSHLSDKSMDEVRGAAGQNRLRREIQTYFNTVLFPDGHEVIQDVLFEEFNVQ